MYINPCCDAAAYCHRIPALDGANRLQRLTAVPGRRGDIMEYASPH